MNVSITEVATTMRTRFESGGRAPEPSDILKVITASNQPGRQEAPVGRAALIPQFSSSRRFALFVFEHALGCLNGRDNNYRHGADQPGKKSVFEKRQNMMHQEVHDCYCSPVAERNQRDSAGLRFDFVKI